jgi:hypothetical protein
MKNYYTLFLLFCFLPLQESVFAQDLYISYYKAGIVSYSLGVVDLETCTYCEQFTIPYNGGAMTDVVPLPNGNIVVLDSGPQISVYDPPSSTPLSTLSFPASLSSGIIAPNGKVWISGFEFNATTQIVTTLIYEYDPTTNTNVIIGSIETPLSSGPMLIFELFYINGTLYGYVSQNIGSNTDYFLVSITLGIPMTLTVLGTLPSGCGAPTAYIPSGPNAGLYGGVFDPDCSGADIYLMDTLSNIALVCDLSPFSYSSGLGAIPPGFPVLNCTCQTDAGQTPTPSAVLCANESLTFDINGENIENNDLMQYILFTNPADTVGSIVVISNIPTFTFGPPLQINTTYYFASVAGDNLNGSVDLNDPCLDFSNANTVIWKPLPGVVLTSVTNVLCEGTCLDITANFTGTPPFSMLYNTPVSSNNLLTSTTSSIVFPVCAPSGIPIGSFLVNAISVSDNVCTCE